MARKICPICGSVSLQRGIRRVEYEYKTKTFYIDQPGEWCSDCGEGIIYPEDHKVVKAKIQAHRASIDGLLPPTDIQAIRESLNLSQKEASLFFGGGVNSFNRYENGINPIPKPLSLLLILLKKHPHQFEELRALVSRND